MMGRVLSFSAHFREQLQGLGWVDVYADADGSWGGYGGEGKECVVWWGGGLI